MNLQEYNFVVFAEEHYNSLGVIRSLGEAGLNPIGIIIKNKIKLTSKSKYLSKVYYVSNRTEGLKILLEKYSNQYRKTFVYTCDDTTEELLDNYYNELKENFFFFNAGKEGRVRVFMDKEVIGKLALKYGLNFLKSKVVNKGEIPKNLEYPVITKAINSTVSGWKNDMFICKNEYDLKEAFNKIRSSSVMIQKYIKKENEYCLEGFSCNNGEDIFISIESTYNYKLPISYSPYMTVNNFSNKNNILSSLKMMFSEIGFEGIFEVEFLEAEDGKLYFGEINFRNSTWSYASTCAEMNLPVLWAESMLKKGLPENCFKNITEPGFKAMVELTDFKERVIKKQYSIIQWIKDFQNCKCKYYVGKEDVKPVIFMLLSRLCNKFM